MRAYQATLAILAIAAHRSALALKGETSSLRLGVPRVLQEMPAPKVPGTLQVVGGGPQGVPKSPGSVEGDGQGAASQAEKGPTTKEKGGEKGAGDAALKADGTSGPKEGKDNKTA